MTDKLRQAAQALVAKLDLIGPDPGGAFSMLAVRGMEYTGPTYGEELEELRGALSTDLQSAGWRDIASAPKDGTVLLVWDGRCAFSGFWGRVGHPANAQSWVGGHCGINHIDQPTHWMPLTPPPDEGSAG